MFGGSKVVKRGPRTNRGSNQTTMPPPEENGHMAHAKGRVKQGDACLSDEDPERMKHSKGVGLNISSRRETSPFIC
ncbi:hypothetical protein AB205_0175070 [Aquarana catesbeiana]|uniref:Uncharacterized protein n=1 Tax=Aquarana catesbeiana TaxID=8400 RepID=A0A2G9RFI4_AQUCT|nr:hypothetical protein AB205_0175070 [Aquarana catesbeiana]